MKYTICILLFCSLFLVNSVHSLAGGQPAAAAESASHALVLVGIAPNPILTRGGTIVHVNHVVTSCRNVLNNEHHLLAPAQFTVRAGGVAFAGDFTTQVTAVFPHPEFNPWTFHNDIAVLRTTTPFPFNAEAPTPNIAPAVLNERVWVDQTPCTVFGFPEPVGGVATLLRLDQPILNRDTQCNAPANHNGNVLESMICAASTVANTGICEHTIGGGLYCRNDFTGIASSGTGCGQATSPGIYTQVRQYVPWITAQYTRTQIPQAGATPPPGVSAGILSTVASSLLIGLAFFLSKL